MPHIIDNIQVGNYIKEKLKLKNMTQDDLATYLSISKSAVSQNLSGKSSFDLQNLLAISQLFDISLDELLTQKMDETNQIVSEYERLAKKGLEEVKKLGTIKPNIFHLDVYGKYFIEYVIALNDVTLFVYLHENNLIVLDANTNREKEILISIIMFFIKHNEKGYLNYIFEYAIRFGSFLVEDHKKEEFIWSFIDIQHDEELVTTLFHDEFIVESKMLKIFQKTKSYNILTKTDWLNICSKYRLIYIFSRIGESILDQVNLPLIINRLHEFAFHDGLIYLVDLIGKISPEYLRSSKFHLQEGFECLCRLDYDQLVHEILKIKPLIDVQKGIIIALNSDANKVIQYLFKNHEKQLKFREIAAITVQLKNLSFMKQIIHCLTLDDIHFALSMTNEHDILMMEYLITKKGRFLNKYYNETTESKISLLLSKYIKDCEAS
jgi:transcriptional regulator with XRE-family HTH domain